MYINFNFLNTFLLVAKHKSFRRAADEVGRSQSAVSMQIRHLEDQIGLPLFQRTTRTVELTPEGEDLVSYAQRAIEELAAGLKRMGEAVHERKSVVGFGCVPSISGTFLAEIAAEFAVGNPRAALRVRELAGVDMLEAVRNQEIDLGIGPSIETASDLLFEPIAEDPICVLATESVVGRERTSLRLAELTELPIIMLSQATILRATLDAELVKQDLTLDAQYEVQQVFTQISMAASGLGAAVLPSGGLPANVPIGLRVIPIRDPSITRTLCIVTRRGHRMAPLTRKLVTIIRGVIGAKLR